MGERINARGIWSLIGKINTAHHEICKFYDWTDIEQDVSAVYRGVDILLQTIEYEKILDKYHIRYSKMTIQQKEDLIRQSCPLYYNMLTVQKHIISGEMIYLEMLLKINKDLSAIRLIKSEENERLESEWDKWVTKV